jgi:hypothetical protein
VSEEDCNHKKEAIIQGALLKLMAEKHSSSEQSLISNCAIRCIYL